MPLALQVKLLRVLEGGTFRRVGGVSDIHVDVRIVSATNINIQNHIEERKFREDLYFRLNVLSVKIASLRDRGDDIELLANHFLEKFAGDKKQFTEGAIQQLKSYKWKGNVRELENIIERVVLLCDSDIIDGGHLPEEIGTVVKNEKIAIPSNGMDIEQLIEDTEKAYLLKSLEKTNGVKTEAAKLLSLTFRSFRHKLKKYGIDKKVITD